MKPIGIGTRVYVGWTNDCHPKYAAERCAFGTVIGGPILPGQWSVTGRRNIRNWNFWQLRMDSGVSLHAAEPILFPLDDDGETEPTEERREVEA